MTPKSTPRKDKPLPNWQRLFDQIGKRKGIAKRPQKAKSLADAKIIGHRWLPEPDSDTGFKEFFITKIMGDSLIDERIASGDWVMYGAADEAKAGQLVMVNTPRGLTVKFYHPNPDGTVTLKAANREHEDQIYLSPEIEIWGIVVTSGRDWKDKASDRAMEG